MKTENILQLLSDYYCVGFQRFLQLSAATYTSYYCQFYIVMLAMKMEHYLSHTDYPLWEVIQKGNGAVSVSTDTNGVIKVLPPKTTEDFLARERERKARTTLLMALPEDHLAKFHKMTDAKDMWDAIKSIFFGNDESKKMQKYILKQQFDGFLYLTQKDCTKVMTGFRVF
ncbi:hypothetical protein Tco_1035645 [Tanacetum coccineum]